MAYKTVKNTDPYDQRRFTATFRKVCGVARPSWRRVLCYTLAERHIGLFNFIGILGIIFLSGLLAIGYRLKKQSIQYLIFAVVFIAYTVWITGWHLSFREAVILTIDIVALSFFISLIWQG